MRRKAFLILTLSLVFLAWGCKEKASREGPTGDIGLEQEIKFIQNVIKDDPTNVNAWIKLGNINMDVRRYPDAIASYAHALKLDPRNVDVRVDMGSCYRYAGMPEKAVEEYRKALEISPDHPNGNKNLAITLADDFKKYDEAADLLEKYLKRNPGDPDAAKMRDIIKDLRRSKPS